MKLSNNALNFLLAQYRAIFKRAYAKGIAPAIMLTAALAAGQAQAANTPFKTDGAVSGDFSSYDVIYNDGKNNTYSGGETWANDVTISNGTTLTISGTDSVHAGGAVLVTGTGSKLVINSMFNGAIADDAGNEETSSLNNPPGSLSITDGAGLEVSGTSIYFDAFNVNNATIDIGGQVGQTSTSGSIADSTQVWVGQTESNSVIEGANTKINLKQHSVLTFGRDAYLKDGEVNFLGSSGDVFESVLQGNKSKTTYLQGTDFKVAATSGGAILANHIVMTDGTINNAGKLVISGRNSGSSDDGAQMSGATFHAADIVMTGGEIINASGATLTIGAATETAWKDGVSRTTFSATGESSIENKGTINFYAGDITLSESNFEGLFTKGTDSEQGKVSFSGSDVDLTVSGSIDLNELGILKEDGTLTENFVIEVGHTVTLAASTINLDSAYKAGNLSLDAGTLNFSGAATNKRFTISSGSITVHDVLNGAAATDRVVIKAESVGNTATLHLAAGANGGKVTNVDRFNVGWSSKAEGTSKLEVDGTWDFGDARITASNNAQVTINGTANNVSDLMMESNGHVTVNGAMTIERLLGAEEGTTGTIDLNGSLTITGDGDLTDEGSNVNNIYFNDVQLPLATVNINNGGTLAITGEDALEDIFSVTKDADGKVTGISVVTEGSKTETHGGWDKSKVKLNAGGTLSISVADIGLTSISTDDLKTLKESLVHTGYQGAFNFGTGLTIKLDETLQNDINEDGEVSYSDLANAGINNVQGVNGVDSKVTVTVDDTTNGNGINLGNNAAAVKLTGSNTALNVSGSLILTNNGGNFVYSEDATGQQTVKGVTVNSNSAVNLTGSGTVGNITEGTSNVTGTSAQLTGTGAGLNVQGSISLDTVDIGAGTVNVSGAVNAQNELNIDGILTVAQGSGAVTIGTSGATIAGGLNAGTITSSGDMAVTGDLVATDLVLSGSNLTLAVGDTTSTGYVAVETLDLNGGMLLIDPDWNSNASFVVVTGANTADVIDVNGSIGVGRNSVGVFGTTAAEAEAALARLGLLNSGKLDQNGIGAALYLGDTLAVADQKHVLVDKTKDNTGLSTEITGMTSSGSVTLTDGAALVISESFTDTLVNDPSQAIFEFGATAGNTVTAESGAQIIFDSADILGGDFVSIASSSGAAITTDLDDAEITAAGGLLTGTADDSTDRITFTLAQGAADHLYNQSNPVRDMTLDVIGNANGAYDSSDAGVYYIGAMNAHNGGADIERTARMAVYAGAVQATLMAQQTSTDAVSERLGMANPNSALIASNNGQGGGLWLSPVYKNHDSDGFDAEGVNYGADIDLYGLALGADFTTESGVRVGAMFNVGSGDAEGQGIGESVSNDFDYYGFTLYAGVTFGNFALTADAGFTQVSNDLEQAVNYHGVGTLTADTDTQTVSVGVRGEYLFATPYVDIVPHVGLRYTNLDLDSYEARFNGYTVAATDADNMSVFSIPFGVTFSKELSMGNWLVKPVFDLNLTANAGDDEIDTNTTFVGVESVALTSEVMDSFTYGASLGIDAQYQESISFGLNVGYTGSSNADEFGLNANARYVF